MSQLHVRNALETKLAAFAASKNNIPVVWENIKSIPTVSYLKAFIFPSHTQDPSFGNHHRRYSGLFRITYYTTALNVGMKSATQFVDDLIDYFPRGLQITSGNLVTRIINTPSATMPMFEGVFMAITVEVPYMADEIKP